MMIPPAGSTTFSEFPLLSKLLGEVWVWLGPLSLIFGLHSMPKGL